PRGPSPQPFRGLGGRPPRPAGGAARRRRVFGFFYRFGRGPSLLEMPKTPRGRTPGLVKSLTSHGFYPPGASDHPNARSNASTPRRIVSPGWPAVNSWSSSSRNFPPNSV